MTKVKIVKEVNPSSTKAWFGCISNPTQTGKVSLSKITSIEGIENINMTGVTDASFMFTGLHLFKGNKLPSNLGAVENAYAMFSYSAFTNDAINKAAKSMIGATNVAFAFAYNKNITSIDLSQLEFSEMVNASCMLDDCVSLTKVEGLAEKSISCTNASCMFYGCSSLANIDIPNNFISSSVQYISGMFAYCSSITSLDISD